MDKNRIEKPQSGFKHNHVFTGYCGDTPYLHYDKGGGVIDGCGRQHINLYGVCNVCNEKILVGKIHVDKDGKLYGAN